MARTIGVAELTGDGYSDMIVLLWSDEMGHKLVVLAGGDTYGAVAGSVFHGDSLNSFLSTLWPANLQGPQHNENHDRHDDRSLNEDLPARTVTH